MALTCIAVRQAQTIIAIAGMFAAGGSAQTRRPVQAPPARVANAWMKVASARSADPVAASLRYARDLAFDRGFGRGGVLTPENAGPAISERAYAGMPPEIENLPNRAILIATFTGFRSVLTASGRAVYTEITFRVSDAIEDASGHASPNSDVTVIVPGGSVTTESGEVISFLTQPRPYYVEPGRTYLMVMTYVPEGDYYVGPGMLPPKTWDLTDGVSKPNDWVEVARERDGGATLLGLTRGQLVSLLRARFAR